MIPAPSEFDRLFAIAPKRVKADYSRRLAAIRAIDAAPRKQKLRAARVWSRRLAVQPSTIWTLRSEYRKRGPIALLDKTFSADAWHSRRTGLPAAAVAHLKKLADAGQLTAQEAVRAFMRQLNRWRKGDASAKIPGWKIPPKGNPPRGLTARNLSRHLALRPRRPVTFRITTVVRSDGLVLSTKVCRL